jgi:hypothetical protein
MTFRKSDLMSKIEQSRLEPIGHIDQSRSSILVVIYVAEMEPRHCLLTNLGGRDTFI